jgi:hypothetical protein
LKITGNHTVLSNAGPEPIIRVSAVPNVLIDGLIVNAAGHQHGLEVTGDCPGLQVSNSIFQSIDVAKPSISLIYLHRGAAGSHEKPVAITGVELRYGSVAFVLGDSESLTPVHDIHISNCHIVGPGSRSSFPFILFDGLQDVRSTANMLEGGNAAISLSLKQPESIKGFEFSWNTLRDFDFVLLINQSSVSQDFRINNNLWLDVGQFSAQPSDLESAVSWCSGNVWKHPANDPEIPTGLAELREEIPLVNTTPGNENYLVPSDLQIKAGHRNFQKD